MNEQEAIMKELEEARNKYGEILGKAIALKAPGASMMVAAKCSLGEVCHGGQF